MAICSPDIARDPFALSEATILGDDLWVTFTFNGGCKGEPHRFAPCWDGNFGDAPPFQVKAYIAHDANGRLYCPEVIAERRALDLRPLADAFREVHPTEPGEIEVNLDGWSGSLLYTFD